MTTAKVTPIYSNCLLLSPDGQPMCRCGEKRAQWYLKRNLAAKIADNPLTVQLQFIPKGLGKANDPYYLAVKENRCVCCGIYENINCHHIVPRCFRQYFPAKLKNHSSYDIVPLCLSCHDRYESYAFQLKQQLTKEFDCPFQGKGKIIDNKALKVKKAATALVNHMTRMPDEKLVSLCQEIKDYFDLSGDLTIKYLIKAYHLNPIVADNIPYGKYIVDNLVNLYEFVVQWRQHFIIKMQPEFMPNHWCVEKKLEFS